MLWSARKQQKKQLLQQALVPGDTVVTGTGQGLLEKTSPRVQDGERVSSMVWTVLSCPIGPTQPHPIGISGDPAWQLVFPRTASVYSYFLMLGTEWNRQKRSPS